MYVQNKQFFPNTETGITAIITAITIIITALKIGLKLLCTVVAIKDVRCAIYVNIFKSIT
jgi:hypothetical protein